MRIDFRNRTLAWALVAALAISLTPTLGAAAAPRAETPKVAEASPWSTLWRSLQDWLRQPGPGDPAAAEGEGEPETDDGPDMDPDG